LVVVLPKVGTVERVLARIAGGQHGLVTRRQLRAAGVRDGEIKQRLATGALLRVYRGVYRVGHQAPSVEARYLGAVLACGDGRCCAAGRLVTSSVP
jgi:predicted transcriptional regulator of viral defense system